MESQFAFAFGFLSFSKILGLPLEGTWILSGNFHQFSIGGNLDFSLFLCLINV